MARRKRSQRWDAVFDRLRCVWEPDKVYPPRATGSDLDAVQAQLDFQFPQSYRAFAERFGLGGSLEVGPRFGIQLTLLDLQGVVDHTLRTRKQHRQPENLPLLYRRSSPRPAGTTADRKEVPPGSRPTAKFGHLVAFAGDFDEGLGTYLFQPLEITDTSAREYRVFALNSARSLRPVADSFWEWVEWVEANYQFPTTEEDEEELPTSSVLVAKPDPPGAILRYERRWLRKKKAPGRKELARWLCWNNSTVQALALSIREEGNPEAFPILADALQEAGCTNTDLLEACRGDPAVDGVWALQVLLGKPPPGG